MSKIKYISIIIGLLFCCLQNINLKAQETLKLKDHYFESSISYGRLIGTEDEDFTTLIKHSVLNVSISYGRQTTGDRDWEKYLNCPDFGFTFKFGISDYSLFQHRFALYAYVNGRFYQSKKFGITYKLGAGLSYWMYPYDSIVNPENIYIGTALNCHIHLELGTYYKISKDADLTLALTVSHSSNGAVKLPNRGANGVGIQLGYRHHMNGRQEINKEFDVKPEPFYAKNSLYVNIGPGFLESKRSGEYKTYFAGTMQIGYTRMPSPKFRYGFGIDLMYSDELQMLLPEEKRAKWKSFNCAAYGSIDLLYNRLVIHLAIAAYTYKAFDFFIPVYERVGVKYQFGKDRNHSAGICMKVHIGSIDHIEWTYGYQFLNWYDKKEKNLRKHKRYTRNYE